MDQFLAELQISGERSHFAVDWARAPEKMGAHLDLEGRDYACHFAQLAYHLGCSQIRLAISGDWLEGSCDGRELDLCLNFCPQSVLLSDYVVKVFCSGGRQLHHQGTASQPSLP